MQTPMKEAGRRITMSVTALALVLGLVVSAHAGVAGAAAAKGGGVLTVGTDISGTITPVTFDPQQFNGPSGFFSYNWPVYAGLLREAPSGAYVPDLASKVTIPDPSTIDIQVRPGLVYSNGTPLNAAAVKAGFERNLANPKAAVWNTAMYAISTIDVTGPESLVLHFSQPVASTFYPLLADEESFMALPTGPSTGSPNTNVVGAGPFMLKSYTPDEKIVLVKNPRYWAATSIKLSGITLVNVPAGPQQVNALESGLVETEVGLPATDIQTLQHNSSLEINSTFPDASSSFAPLCKSSGPLANLKVRQALSYATDRTAINTSLLYGKGQPAWSFFPSTSAYYDKSLTGLYAYNVKKAKELLAQAGYPHGFSTSIMALPEPEMAQLATVLQAEWKQIGVTLQIVQTSNYVTDLYRDNKAQIGLNPEGVPGVAKVTQYVPGTVGDLCAYNSPTLTALVDQVEALPPSSPKLKTVWDQLQQFVITNALSVYIDFTPLVTAASTKVKNLQVVPYVGGVVNYWGVSVSS
jgi:peptide/nickel transport system substrate-binding protein